jgi:predicted GIY-YIG superfamily endonuclease
MTEFAYTYVLQMADGTRYIGSTPDLARRIEQHHCGEGGRTTRLQSGELIYYEACRSLDEARKREKQLKTGYGRAYLNRRLAFEKGNPT